jgi:hypothetical protein
MFNILQSMILVRLPVARILESTKAELALENFDHFGVIETNFSS